ncbi:MAG: DNA repair protein RadC [Patescibacteria group bacterium]
MTSLKSLLQPDRPREKLEKYGVETLSTTELLMLILGSGSKRLPVHKLARKIEKQFEDSKQVTLQDLLCIKGIGLAKACQILASLELVERLQPRIPDEVLNSVDKIVVHLYDLKAAPREKIVGLYLNARMKLIHKEVLSVGSLNQALIAPKEVFSVIKHMPIAHFVLAHNHPSGEASPSLEDLQFTARMAKSGELLGVNLLDHIIITKTDHYSFKRHGKL